MDKVGDLYALLSVLPDASADEIRNAYRRLASYFHPDVNQSPAAVLMFQEVKKANDILSDASSRAEYDASRRSDRSKSSLSLSTMMSRNSIMSGEDAQWLYVMATLEPPSGQTANGSTPLNLALIIDRSTSMDGERMSQLKAAAHRIVDELDDQDVVSVVTFSDRAEVMIPAGSPKDRRTMKATISTMRASGATAIYQGLKLGLEELSKHLHPRYINHMIMITDGRTYGDEDACIRVAEKARAQGVGISAMGLGDDWNDDFLDTLASTTGASSAYIASARAVSTFLENRIRSLGTAYAERANLMAVPSRAANLDRVFRVSPDPLPLDSNEQPIALGMLDTESPTSVLLRFSLTAQADEGALLPVGRIQIQADILGSERSNEVAVEDVSVTVSQNMNTLPPPPELAEAVDILTLYDMQDRARQDVANGNIDEATQRLRTLATRLFEHGESELGQAAMGEAEHVAATKVISDEGMKQIKYGTRALVLPQDDER